MLSTSCKKVSNLQCRCVTTTSEYYTEDMGWSKFDSTNNISSNNNYTNTLTAVYLIDSAHISIQRETLVTYDCKVTDSALHNRSSIMGNDLAIEKVAKYTSVTKCDAN